VNDEMLKPLLEGKTIKQTIDERRLFIIDLAILEGVPAKTPELVVSHEHLPYITSSSGLSIRYSLTFI
jgi:hypothetical protein